MLGSLCATVSAASVSQRSQARLSSKTEPFFRLLFRSWFKCIHNVMINTVEKLTHVKWFDDECVVNKRFVVSFGKVS